jgi:choline-sulfatase
VFRPSKPSLALAALVTAASACRSAPPRETPAPPSVLLITIDTLRADRLHAGLTPTLDRLAAEGLEFARARAAVPLTLPSHATILSGLLPPHHGVRENATYRFDRSQPTVAMQLKARGYRTGAVVGAYVLDRQFGLDAGFDTYDDRIPRDPDQPTRLESERRATAVTDAALAWLDGAIPPAGTTGAPFFAWVHYYDPHAPYTPPPAFAARAGGNRYNGEVAYVDAEVARLLEGLARRQALERVAILVAGDHGESLGEHGEQTHGMLLYEPVLRVPLIVRAPGLVRPGVRQEPVSLADLAPTILGLAGATPPAVTDGVNLLGAAAATDREIYSETNYPRLAGWSPLRSLVSGQWKLVRAEPPELFDVDRDASESNDVSGQRASLAAAMDRRLTEIEGTGRQAASAPSRDTQDRLRSLGYVAASPTLTVPASAPNPAREIAAWNQFEDALSDVSAGRTAAALPRLRALADRYPDAQVFRRSYAQALLDAGRAPEALRAFRAIVARWPAEAPLLHDVAVAAREAHDPAEAIRAEQAAIALDPSYPAAHDGLGLLFVDARKFADAAAAFERAATLEASSPSFWTNLGNARRELNDGAGAESAYRRALAADPSWPDAANGLGVLLVQAGRPADAVPWIEKAVARSPRFYEARLNLGIALQQAGQTDRAREAYRAVLAAPPSFGREREAARKLLEGLGR